MSQEIYEEGENIEYTSTDSDKFMESLDLNVTGKISIDSITKLYNDNIRLSKRLTEINKEYKEKYEETIINYTREIRTLRMKIDSLKNTLNNLHELMQPDPLTEREKQEILNSFSDED